MRDHDLHFEAGDAGRVTAILRRPPGADRLLVLAHGAGAGMRHPFLESLAAGLQERRIATFRYQFPYMQAGRRRPDRQPVLLATVRAAAVAAREAAGDLALLAGGKSMGGRMTSLACSQEPLAGVRALVFFGFPLHPPGKPSVERADHLAGVRLPMLFLQGDRDAFGGLELVEAVVRRLGSPATLHVVAGADHGFHVLKSSGRSDTEILEELAETTSAWSRDVVGLTLPASAGPRPAAKARRP